MKQDPRHIALFLRSWPRAVAGLLMATFALVWGIAPAASADGQTPAPVTWSVSPADEQGPLKQSWVELELDPGSTAERHLAVRNLGDRDVTFAITAADGYFTDKGRFNMLPADATSVAAGTWIAVQGKVTVAAGGTAIVPFTVAVPDDATPGDHAAGIAASIYSQGAQEGSQVSVESRVGFRVMTRVKGELSPQLAVSPRGQYDMTWNPFAPGAATVDVDLENTGNVRLKVSAATAGGTQPGQDAKSGEAPAQELLPGDKRTITLKVADVWPLGPVTVPVTVAQDVVTASGSVESMAPVVHEATIWAMPWPQLMVFLAVLLLVFGLFWGQKRRKKQMELLVVQARESGRLEAQRESGNVV